MERTTCKLFLNIIWHQHQPSYLDPEKDQLQGPWVRTHGTKDYYDMASILENYPDIHCTYNLTSSLLTQLTTYYVDRLKPFVDINKNTVAIEPFFKQCKGKTDPWIDLALKPTITFDNVDLKYLLYNPWNALHITEVMLSRFPQYKLLKEKFNRKEQLTEQDLREIKFWFFLAYFDPDFLEKRIQLVDGSIIDLTDIITKHDDGTYHLKKTITEYDCNRIIAETFKIISNIIPIHKKLMYDYTTCYGQIDIATTPFYHPILPLIIDTDLARICQPHSPLPKRFHYPQDAHQQVGKAVKYFTDTFGKPPSGMWPAEGAVAQEVIEVFAQHGIEWIASDEKILTHSKPYHQPKYYMYRLGKHPQLAIIFRDTELSDRIGFTYQHFKGEDAANDFIRGVLKYLPKQNEPDRLLTVILDGENAWEWYRYDNDGKEFLHSLYKKLTELFEQQKVTTVTVSEFIHGNPHRGVQPHPISTLPALDWLYPGSWINASFDTWIGINEKNQAWEYLHTVREDLKNSKIPPPDPYSNPPKENTQEWYAYMAWEELFAAEGSDWFWWYGTKQQVMGGIKPFDIAFIKHIQNVYRYAKLAGAEMPHREFTYIAHEQTLGEVKVQGTMIQNI